MVCVCICRCQRDLLLEMMNFFLRIPIFMFGKWIIHIMVVEPKKYPTTSHGKKETKIGIYKSYDDRKNDNVLCQTPSISKLQT